MPLAIQDSNALENFLQENWSRDGYKDSIEEQEYFDKGRKYLNEYYNNRQDEGEVIFSEEMVFNKINESLTLCGKIDKVFINNNNEIEVLDYKTGEKFDLSLDLTTDIQLPIYILLTKYKLNTYPQIVSYYHLPTNKKISVRVNRTTFIKSVDNLKSIIREMFKESTYVPTPTKYCNLNCEYFKYCDVYKKRDMH
jgi:hypothetical protein